MSRKHHLSLFLSSESFGQIDSRTEADVLGNNASRELKELNKICKDFGLIPAYVWKGKNSFSGMTEYFSASSL